MPKKPTSFPLQSKLTKNTKIGIIFLDLLNIQAIFYSPGISLTRTALVNIILIRSCWAVPVRLRSKRSGRYLPAGRQGSVSARG